MKGTIHDQIIINDNAIILMYTLHQCSHLPKDIWPSCTEIIMPTVYTFVLLLYSDTNLSMVQQYDQFQVSVDTFPSTQLGMWLLKLLQLAEV